MGTTQVRRGKYRGLRADLKRGRGFQPAAALSRSPCQPPIDAKCGAKLPFSTTRRTGRRQAL